MGSLQLTLSLHIFMTVVILDYVDIYVQKKANLKFTRKILFRHAVICSNFMARILASDATSQVS